MPSENVEDDIGFSEKEITEDEDEDEKALSLDSTGNMFEKPSDLKRTKKTNPGLKIKISKRVLGDTGAAAGSSSQNSAAKTEIKNTNKF